MTNQPNFDIEKIQNASKLKGKSRRTGVRRNQITLYTPDDLFKKLEDYCKANQLSRSALVSALIREYLKQSEASND